MDEESANWCRLVQTIIHKGGEVLRQFLQLEILTKIFTKYSRFWMNNVHNPYDINYMEILANNLNRSLIGFDNPSEKIIEELLDSWSTTRGQRMKVIEQIDRIKEWKQDVNNKCLNSVSNSDNIILNNCLSQIEQEIEKLDSVWTFLNKLDYTFHCNLQIAQTDLLLEIEKNDEFLSRCRQILISLSKPSSTEFQQHVHSFKKELNIWKTKCRKVLRGFKEECDTLIASGLREAECSPQGNILIRFLNDFKININNENLQLQIDIFCDMWDDDLHNVFDRYEKKIPDSDSTVILSLSQSLCTELEKFPTFKEKKFQDFLLTATKLPGLSAIERSKLKDISRCSNLNEFDFNLLIAVLIHGNFVHSPPPNRDEDPHKLDTSISADILRLRAYRNNIVDHTVKISSDSFDKLWKELLMLLRKIAFQCGDNFNKKISMEIDQMKDHPLEPHRESKLQKKFLTWCRKDILNQLPPETYMYLEMLQSLQTAEKNLSRRQQARTCCSCKKEFPTESELEKHTRIHKDCRCLSCNKEFLTERELELHMKYHEARTCLRCNMECSTEKGLARHMMCHQGHICLSCNQQFSTGTELERHLRYHQACTCRSCRMEFPTENELAEHVRNHRGDHNAPEILLRNERKQFAIEETSKLIEQDTSPKRPASDDNYYQPQKKQKVDKERSSVETSIHPLVQNMEESEEVEEEDEEGDLQDEYEFFEAVRNDDQKVEDMIRNQKIPNQRIVEVAMKQDRCSSGIKRALIEMSKLLRKKISNAVGVWCGYRSESPHTPVFVITLKDKNCILKKEDIPKPFINYKMITRYKHVPNEEERNIVKQYGRNSVRAEDVAHVTDTIAKHTKKYMKEHSNLSIIRPCSVKSFGYTTNEMDVKNITCIVFYVPVKGVIPVGEKEFPKYIDGIITDVREGEFLLFGRHTAMEYHTKLKIGCCITNGIKNGSLGGFVDLSGGKVGCLTAGHVVLRDDDIENYLLKSNKEIKELNDSLAQGTIQIKMHQPEMDHRPFGKVQTIALDAGNIFTPSVDAAVIQITDDDRQPETGSFPDGNFEMFDVTKDDPLFYTSGEISDVPTYQKDYRVIKFGCTTGLTSGYLQRSESSVRQVDVWGNYCFPVMFGQFEVSEPDFADMGDSGALAFLCVDNNIRNLQAVGMVIGGHSTGCSCLITPIKAVFEKLGLTNDKFKVFHASRLSQVIECISKHDQIVESLSSEVSLINQKVATVDEIEAKVTSLEKSMKDGFESIKTEMIKGFRELNEKIGKNEKSDSS